MSGDSTYHIPRLLLRPFGVVVGAFLLLTIETFASDLQMKIDDVKFEANALVKFVEVGPPRDTANPARLNLKKMIAARTNDNQYTVFADIDSITVNPSFETYYFYVRSASAATSAPLTRFTFQVYPYDTFPDQGKTIHIHLLDGDQDRTVDLLSIPLHSLKSGTFLWTQSDASVRVRLAEDTISIDLQNKYLLPVMITGVKVDPVPLTHWTAQPVLASSVQAVLGTDASNDHTTLVWKVQPRALGVLHDSVWPFSSNPLASGADQSSDALEKLTFSIDYVPVQGGFHHTLIAIRHVSFYPSFPALVGVAGLGALAGGLVMFFGIRRDKGSFKFVKYLWPNIILAMIIELVAIVLFSFDNSKIQIGSVNLNPTLLIPAATLGAISVFYGFQLVEKWLGKAGSNAPIPAPGGEKP